MIWYELYVSESGMIQLHFTSVLQKVNTKMDHAEFMKPWLLTSNT